ncbi:MAG TPA: cytochrome c oxidase subunit 3 [Candidatus Limnocylindrales bacterium]|nr:cytochrome c oxidase subunit 3 [Candidatus Limnocylindrales bacterium]
MHRTGELYGQFETLEQQKDSATLGMWIFLVTEVLFFGGLFLTYSINRHLYFTAFGVGGNMLDLRLGATNTVVLIASSFTMAMSVWAAQTSRKKLLPIFLLLTLILGFVFLGIKYVEYKQKFDHHLVPGHSFDLTYRINHPGPGDDAKELAAEREEIAGALRTEAPGGPQEALTALNAHAQLYFSLYFGMTGLHALHMVVGAGLLVWVLRESLKGRFSAAYNTPIEIVGLYWHFVDIVWIYLFALLYLINRHAV